MLLTAEDHSQLARTVCIMFKSTKTPVSAAVFIAVKLLVGWCKR